MTASRRLVALAILSGSLVLTACGTDPDQPQADATAQDTAGVDGELAGRAVDACTLLTADVVSAAVGADAEEGETNVDASNPQRSVCQWPTDVADGSFVQVLVGDAESSGDEPGIVGDPVDVDITGASEAYYVGGIVGAQVDGYFLQVTVVPEDDDAALELADQAAQALG